MTVLKEKMGCILVKEKSPYNEMVDMMFADLFSKTWMHSVVEEHSPSKLIYSLLHKQKVQKLGGYIFNPILIHAYELEKTVSLYSSQYEKLVVLFLNSSVVHLHYPAKILQLMKQKYRNTFWVLYYIDVIESPQSIYANQLRAAGIFDLVYTFDKQEAKKHNLRYWNTVYSKKEEYLDVLPKTNLYFCGAEKGRIQEIVAIAEQCLSANIKYKMDVVFDQKCETDIRKYENIIVHENGDFLTYKEVLQSTLQAQCILEIVQKGQKAPTLRPFEAVCYRRKLLTNNSEIFKFPYYDPRYIHYYEKIEEIDWNWILQENVVDFSYQDDFSPNALFDDIRNNILDGGA